MLRKRSHRIHRRPFITSFSPTTSPTDAVTARSQPAPVETPEPDYLAIVGNIAYNGAQDNARTVTAGLMSSSPSELRRSARQRTPLHWGKFCLGEHRSESVWRDGADRWPWDLLRHGERSEIQRPNPDRMNNISVFNGASGIHIFDNAGNSPNAAIYIRNNTTYGNQTGAINASPCAEVPLSSSLSTTVSMNLVQASGSSACNVSGSPQPLFALGVSSPDSTDVLKSNFLIYSQNRQQHRRFRQRLQLWFKHRRNQSDLANPVKNPPAPNCGNSASVPACMATVVADFTPKAAAAAPYGYQTPSSTQTFDPLFPQWLCTVSVPSGLVTMGCGQQSSLPPKPSLSVIKVQ